MEKSSFVTALKRLLRVREASLFLVLALLCAVIQLRNSNFLTPNVINSIFKNYAYTMTMSVGMLLVLLIGGIDISVGATLALAGMSAALLQKAEILPNAVTVYLFSTGVGLVCGIIIGLVIAKGKVIPIIATLGFMYIYRGLTYFVSDSTWVGTAYMLQDFKTFAQGTTLGINNLVCITLCVYVVFFIILRWTRIGRQIYAVGSNVEAAEVSGIPIDRIKICLLYTSDAADD